MHQGQHFTHLKNIYTEREHDLEATTEESSVVQMEGGREVARMVTFYSLEAIIAVGYRVSSPALHGSAPGPPDRLKDYILKGFAIDKDRFKRSSRFDQRYFEELLEKVRDTERSETASRQAARSVAEGECRCGGATQIRASERLLYHKITDIYATAADY